MFRRQNGGEYLRTNDGDKEADGVDLLDVQAIEIAEKSVKKKYLWPYRWKDK